MRFSREPKFKILPQCFEGDCFERTTTVLCELIGFNSPPIEVVQVVFLGRIDNLWLLLCLHLFISLFIATVVFVFVFFLVFLVVVITHRVDSDCPSAVLVSIGFFRLHPLEFRSSVLEPDLYLQHAQGGKTAQP